MGEEEEEANMSSEATKMLDKRQYAHGCAFDVTVLKSYVIFDLRSHYHYRTLVFRAIALLLSQKSERLVG